MHFSAMFGIYGNKATLLEISKSVIEKNWSVIRGHPDSPTIILKQRLHCIIRQSTCSAEDCR
jgi:hypothetical protein